MSTTAACTSSKEIVKQSWQRRLLPAGLGLSIAKQRGEIERYKAQFDEEMETFKGMDEPAVNRWCFYDLKKRGAIE